MAKYTSVSVYIAPTRVSGIDINSEDGGFQTPALRMLGTFSGLNGASTAFDRIR